MAAVTATVLLDTARSQLGIHENPLGSNNVVYNTWFYGRPVSGKKYPWCSAFVSWLFFKLNAKDLIHVYSAYSGDILHAGRQHGEEVLIYQARPGDIVIYDYGDGGRTDHIGVVEERLGPTTFRTIEGNTGDAVKRQTRSASDVTMWFTRPKYAVPPPPPSREEDCDMIYPMIEQPKQEEDGKEWFVYVAPEVLVDLHLFKEIHPWINIYAENGITDIRVYSSPASGQHKFTLQQWERRSLNCTDYLSMNGAVIIKSSKPIAATVSLFCRWK